MLKGFAIWLIGISQLIRTDDFAWNVLFEMFPFQALYHLCIGQIPPPECVSHRAAALPIFFCKMFSYQQFISKTGERSATAHRLLITVGARIQKSVRQTRSHIPVHQLKIFPFFLNLSVFYILFQFKNIVIKPLLNMFIIFLLYKLT